MGKLNDLFKKIKGIFNKNKALPAGSKENIVDVNTIEPQNITTDKKVFEELQEIKEETQMSGHEKFVNDLKNQAEQFDLSSMSRGDAIVKFLEVSGLNPAYSKNPAFKNLMCELFQNDFMRIESELSGKSPTEQRSMLSKAFNMMDYTINNDGSFEIHHHGDDSYASVNPSKDIFYNLDEEKNELNVVTNYKESSIYRDEIPSHLQNNLFKDSNGKILNSYRKSQSTYDKNGLEMMSIYVSYDSSDTNPYISGSTRCIRRNDDLVNATETVYDSSDANQFNSPNSNLTSNFYGDLSASKLSLIVPVTSQYPEKLSCPIYSYDSIKEIKDGKQDAPIPNDLYNHDVLKEFCEKSPLFKKVAEERNLLSKEEVGIEQE